MDDRTSAVASVAAIADRVRAELYRFVRHSARPVTRDEAAVSAGISRRLAAFHLDKLVAVGLLRARYDAAGRTATVGRSPKVYEPSGQELRVQLPERRYELMASILLEAVAGGSGDSFGRALTVARAQGRDAGATGRPPTPGGRIGAERGLRAVEAVLARHGYEPALADRSTLLLRNCPFHQLTRSHRDITCRLNHAYCVGVLDGVGAPALNARLVPSESHCCVRVDTGDVDTGDVDTGDVDTGDVDTGGTAD
jgi:predicted ArsR family transcriptional regulator